MHVCRLDNGLCYTTVDRVVSGLEVSVSAILKGSNCSKYMPYQLYAHLPYFFLLRDLGSNNIEAVSSEVFSTLTNLEDL